jgi:glycosyltransferase involved in cell wall biosynthesis
LEPEVTVVVPTHNRADQLQRSLRALAEAAAAVPVTVEVIVVDDGSQDATPKVIRDAERSGLVRGLRRSEGGGPAVARNLGWRAGAGRLVAFTDDDCEVAPGWLGALVPRLRQAPEHVAGIGGRVLPARDDRVSAYMTLHRILEPPASLRYVVTANCIFRRSALERVGGFDEAVRAPGGEDPGLCLKLGRLGHTFDFEPAAVVKHHYRSGFWEFLRTFYRYGKGCRIVMDS